MNMMHKHNTQINLHLLEKQQCDALLSKFNNHFTVSKQILIYATNQFCGNKRLNNPRQKSLCFPFENKNLC